MYYRYLLSCYSGPKSGKFLETSNRSKKNLFTHIVYWTILIFLSSLWIPIASNLRCQFIHSLGHFKYFLKCLKNQLDVLTKLHLDSKSPFFLNNMRKTQLKNLFFLTFKKNSLDLFRKVTENKNHKFSLKLKFQCRK